jgi:hypothetical protein
VHLLGVSGELAATSRPGSQPFAMAAAGSVKGRIEPESDSPSRPSHPESPLRSATTTDFVEAAEGGGRGVWGPPPSGGAAFQRLSSPALSVTRRFPRSQTVARAEIAGYANARLPFTARARSHPASSRDSRRGAGALQRRLIVLSPQNAAPAPPRRRRHAQPNRLRPKRTEGRLGGVK